MKRYAALIEMGRGNRSLSIFPSDGRMRAGIFEFATTDYFPGVKVRIVEFALRSDD